MNSTRALAIAAITLLSAACSQQDLTSEPMTPVAPTSIVAAPTTDVAAESPAPTTPDVDASTDAPTTDSPTTDAPTTDAPATDPTPVDSTSTVPDTPETPTTIAPEPPQPVEPTDVPEVAPPVPPTEPPTLGDPIITIEPTTPDPDPGPGPAPLDLIVDAAHPHPIQPATDLVIAVPVVPCGLTLPIPGDALAVESILIDVDNDGAADTVTSYFANDWRLRLDLSSGPTSDVAITGVGGAGMARILGDAQVDWNISDPVTYTAELIVQAGANASGVNLTVFGITDDGCLFRFSDQGGSDIVLPVHTSIGSLSGLLCDHVAGSGFLVEMSASHAGGTTYNATSTQLVRVGTTLVPGNSLDHSIDSETQAGWLSQFGDLTCGGAVLD